MAAIAIIVDHINDKGSTLDVYKQNSRNFALFTHNIFHVTPKLDLTVGLRYTNERKKLNATFGNDNTACAANQALVGPFADPNNPSFPAQSVCGVGGDPRLSCQGNSTSELNGVSIHDKRKENKLTGTGVLSLQADRQAADLRQLLARLQGRRLQPRPRRRSSRPTVSFASLGGAQALVGNLQFEPETVDAWRSAPNSTAAGSMLNVALFREQFKNFQLNTFNGVDVHRPEHQQLLPTWAARTPTTAARRYRRLPAQGRRLRRQLDRRRGRGHLPPDARADDQPRLHLRRHQISPQSGRSDDGTPLNPALCSSCRASSISNAPKMDADRALGLDPADRVSGMHGLFYVDARILEQYNTGSDLDPEKMQKGFTVVNGRVGIAGPDERWALEVWAQNLFNKDYAQVAFNSPFQQGVGTPPCGAGFSFAPFSIRDTVRPPALRAFLGRAADLRRDVARQVGLRSRAAPPRLPPPPPPPPPPPATQTCSRRLGDRCRRRLPGAAAASAASAAQRGTPERRAFSRRPCAVDGSLARRRAAPRAARRCRSSASSFLPSARVR